MNKVWDDLMNGHKYNQNSSPELHRVRMTKTHDSTVMWYAEMVTKTVKSLAVCFQHLVTLKINEIKLVMIFKLELETMCKYSQKGREWMENESNKYQ